MGRLKKITKIRETGVLIPLLLLWIVTYAANDAFFSRINMIALFRTSSITLLGALGASFIFACGMMDVSAGSVYGLSGMIVGICLKHLGLPVPVAIVLALLVGLIIGLLNGFIVNNFGLPAFIATMGTQYIGRGFCNVVTQGESINSFPEAFNKIGSFGFFRIPWSIYISIVLAIIVFLVFKYTTFGRSLLAVGGNRETARVCGINVRRICNGAFIIAGLLAATAGVLSVARLGTAQAAAGTGWEMTCIAAAIIGGVSMFGGYVTIPGVAIGVLLMETLTISMTMLRVNAYWQKIAIGIVIIFAVGIDTYRRKSLSGGK